MIQHHINNVKVKRKACILTDITMTVNSDGPHSPGGGREFPILWAEFILC